MPQNTALSGQQLKAIAALAQGKNQRAAAKAAGCDRSTLQRWLAENEEFRNQLAWAKQEIYESVIAKLLAASDQAIATLLEISGDKGQSGSARVSAARAILEIALRGVAADELNRAIAVCRKYELGVVDLRRKNEGVSEL